MDLEHIRLLLNKHMKKRRIRFTHGERRCCFELCGDKYNNKMDLYLGLDMMLTMPVPGAAAVWLWWLSSVSEDPEHETVTSVALVFCLVDQKRFRFSCKFVHNGRFIMLDDLDELFIYAKQLLPGK